MNDMFKNSLHNQTITNFQHSFAGLAGFVAAGLIGAYKYKHRGTMSTSVFLMQLRVAAQGTVVGCLTLGLAYTMYNQYFVQKPKEE